jgi:hypothetical protein
VIELECGITVYPAREEQGPWRAVWHENGARQQCEAASEEKLAAKLAKVTERLEADAPNMTLRGADLIAFYLSPDRLPAQRQWSRKHAHTQRRLCERFAVPAIGAVLCQDITTGHMQKIVNAASTPGEGGRVQGMISALVSAAMIRLPCSRSSRPAAVLMIGVPFCGSSTTRRRSCKSAVSPAPNTPALPCATTSACPGRPHPSEIALRSINVADMRLRRGEGGKPD